MLKIRLQRTGRENTPTYRIVVAEKSAPAKGKFLEIVGHYLPARDPVILEHREERITHWISKGAIPSDTVARILAKKGMKGLDKYFQKYAKQRPKGEEPAAQAEAPKAEIPKAEAPKEEAPKAEAPAPEAKESSDTETKEG
ncbi:30S ribosomal protein S16 [Candidatus Peribacteria bacterium RIFCSPHIGHO2_02_FULL_52_16]|nr:MAG: 30S ribosomal protein S16 [Candidatus Peribacteria bacterium RIFCSPHIGHO2_01_FULL_51_35]OGJ61112.1 MAG: 30S ribosomal protein S16 [Candidatus Peribacteria bacterium RIFCSPHIGHO2_02_FULL_52_16]